MDKETREYILAILTEIKNKRARIMIEHILAHGFITTEDLEKYGYRHPPRAARDVREAGIPLETYRVTSSDGSRKIAAYRFGDIQTIKDQRRRGRKSFPKQLKQELYQQSGGRCAICGGFFDTRYLQIDHRVPYEIAGDISINTNDPSNFMLLCGSCNRAKSWSCEHCPNWEEQSFEVCLTCYWANPETYQHIATINVRRLDILFSGDSEVSMYESLKRQAHEGGATMPEFVKVLLARITEEDR